LDNTQNLITHHESTKNGIQDHSLPCYDVVVDFLNFTFLARDVGKNYTCLLKNRQIC